MIPRRSWKWHSRGLSSARSIATGRQRVEATTEVKAMTRRRPAQLSSDLLSTRERDAARRRRRHRGEGDAAARTRVRIVEGTGPATAVAKIPEAPQLTKRQIYIIDKPAAAQSQIRIGWVGVPRSTPDYPTMQVLNTVLGGSFTSRLNTNLRETHGYSYGAGSGFEERISPGSFSARAGVQTDKTAEASEGVLQRAHRHPQASPGRRTGQGEELCRARFPSGVREHR